MRRIVVATISALILATLLVFPNEMLTNSSKAEAASGADSPVITNLNSSGFCDGITYNFKINPVPKAQRYYWKSTYEGASVLSQYKVPGSVETQVVPSVTGDPRDAKVKVRLVYPSSNTRHYIYIPDFLNKPAKISAIRLPNDNHDQNDGTVGQITIDKLEELYKRAPSVNPYSSTGIFNRNLQGGYSEYKQVMIEWDNYAKYRNRDNGWPTRGNNEGWYLDNDKSLFDFAKYPYDIHAPGVDSDQGNGKFPGLDFTFDESRYLHWFHDDNDNGYKLKTGYQQVVYYYETTLNRAIFKPNSIELDPKYTNSIDSKVGFMGAEQSGYWKNQTNSYAYPIYIEQIPVGGKIHGFYDSPYLLSGLYGTPENKDFLLPKGMNLSGHFYFSNTGETVKNVIVQRGNRCYKFPNGNINFSGNSLGDIWNVLGQEKGVQYYFPSEYADQIFVPGSLTNKQYLQFSYDIWEDPTFTKQADFIYYDTNSTCPLLTDDSTPFIFDGKRINITPAECKNRDRSKDRMRTGYLKGTYQGKQVPIKVMYYLEANRWRPQRSNDFTVRLRPSVLRDPDPTYPLNPVAISPYKNLVKWITFDDATINDELQVGKIVEREVIPGFLKAKCEVTDIQAQEYSGGKWVKSSLDTWAPGYYYQDAAPWMIGDDRRIAIHQTGDKNFSKVKLKCWGERFDPGIGRDVRVTIPVNGFVTLDAESTDGLLDNGTNNNIETLGIHTEDSNGKYYPIYAFSSCNKQLVDLIRSPNGGNTFVPEKVRESTARSETNNISPWDPNTPVGLVFSNRGGRCGEIPFRNVYSIPFGATDFGMIFGPSMMVTAPIDNFHIRDVNPKKNITVSMNGLGKEAVGFGVILSADTSNADFNNLMPPVYQYASLSFHGGKDDTHNTVDWSDPREFVNNFYYYGARVGKRAVVYDPNRTDGLKVRDGQNNDGQPADLVDFKANPDSEITIQPKIKPIANGSQGSAYTSDKPGTYLAGQDTYKLVNNPDGATLVPSPRPASELTVTVPCGKNYQKDKTFLRAWADFNGNGIFDPDEASSVASCNPQPSGLVMQPFSKDLPWTDTTPVDLKFTYPMQHDLNGKRNVWMRVRAISESDLTKEDIIGAASNQRSTAEGWTDSVRQVNPDADAPASRLGSAIGSWKLSESGETEDYLFDITPPPPSKDDTFCYSANTASTIFDPLANDIDLRSKDTASGRDPEIDRRKPDPRSLVFTREQDSSTIKISNNGKQAEVSGEGTYAINPSTGKVTFTPTAAFRTTMQGTASSHTLTSLKYAFTTAQGSNIYDRAVAASAKIQGSAGKMCKLEVEADTWLESTGQYRWSMDKQVQQLNSTGTYVKNDDRGVQVLPKDARINLSYKIKLKAQAQEVVAKELKGRITLRNPESNSRNISSFSFYNPYTNQGLEGGLGCSIDPGQLPDTLPALATKAYTFTCSKVNSSDKDLADLAHKVAIGVKLSNLPDSEQEVIPSFQRDSGEAVYASNAYNVFLKDFLWDSRTSGVATTLGDVSVKYRIINGATSTVKLRDLVVNGGQLVAAGSPNNSQNGSGEAEITFSLPEVNQPQMPEANTKVIFNQAKLCIYGDPCVQDIVPRINPDAYTSPEPLLPKTPALWRENEQKDGSSPAKVAPSSQREANSSNVAESLARVSVTTPEPTKTLYVKKVDNSGVGLPGAEFAIYHDSNDRISTVKYATLAPRDPKLSANAASEFIAPDLEILKPYWLVEKKAPRGHHLLAQPVQFQILKDGSVQFLEGYSGFITGEKDPGTANPIIKVRDVEAGILPGSGGRGVIIAIALGIVLFASAYIVARRQTKSISENSGR